MNHERASARVSQKVPSVMSIAFVRWQTRRARLQVLAVQVIEGNSDHPQLADALDMPDQKGGPRLQRNGSPLAVAATRTS